LVYSPFDSKGAAGPSAIHFLGVRFQMLLHQYQYTWDPHDSAAVQLEPLPQPPFYYHYPIVVFSKYARKKLLHPYTSMAFVSPSDQKPGGIYLVYLPGVGVRSKKV